MEGTKLPYTYLLTTYSQDRPKLFLPIGYFTTSGCILPTITLITMTTSYRVLKQTFIQARCPFSHTTNSIKAQGMHKILSQIYIINIFFFKIQYELNFKYCSNYNMNATLMCNRVLINFQHTQTQRLL